MGILEYEYALPLLVAIFATFLAIVVVARFFPRISLFRKKTTVKNKPKNVFDLKNEYEKLRFKYSTGRIEILTYFVALLRIDNKLARSGTYIEEINREIEKIREKLIYELKKRNIRIGDDK